MTEQELKALRKDIKDVLNKHGFKQYLVIAEDEEDNTIDVFRVSNSNSIITRIFYQIKRNGVVISRDET